MSATTVYSVPSVEQKVEVITVKRALNNQIILLFHMRTTVEQLFCTSITNTCLRSMRKCAFLSVITYPAPFPSYGRLLVKFSLTIATRFIANAGAGAKPGFSEWGITGKAASYETRRAGS